MSNISTQTDFSKRTNVNVIERTLTKRSFFNHLDFANQTYFEHFCDSMKYSIKSTIASFYFFWHAIWPDIYTKSGSNIIHDLSNIIYDKYDKRMCEIMSNI